jgi:hypothetical protein
MNKKVYSDKKNKYKLFKKNTRVPFRKKEE